MARPKKVGLDYFPLDVSAMADPKLRAPRQEFGYLATVVYLALLCILYRDKGYYIEYSDRTREDVIWSITTEFLTGKYQPGQETIAKVIDRLAACGLFDGDLYRQGYITSKRAQETYYKATLDRKAISVDWALWLLDETGMTDLSTRSVILQNFVSRPINGVSRPINEVSRPGKYTKESKRKESKVKQSKEANDGPAAGPSASVIGEEFERSFGRPPDRAFLRTAEALITPERPLDWVRAAIRQAGGKQGCQNPEAYALGVIRQYQPRQDTPRPAPARRPWQPSPPLDGALTDWEKQWLADVRARRAARQAKENGTGPEEGGRHDPD